MRLYALALFIATVFILHTFARPTEIQNSFDAEASAIINTCDETNSHNWFIYCSGRLLETAMNLHLYNDSKTFVDKPLLHDAIDVHNAFEARFGQSASIGKEELQKFIDENFAAEGTELQNCELSDWHEDPPQLASIKDSGLHKWALKLHSIWKLLCRKMKPEVSTQPDRYSLLYVPNQFVVPGGRFREFYYWDAYWILKGLLASGMTSTTKHMIENFVHIVETYGFIPNGGRVYYLRRSQPPLLIPMVYDYYEATGDIEFVKSVLPTLEKELMFWYTNRQINVTVGDETATVFQYRTASNVPRPESFREDAMLAADIESPDEKRRLYRNLASAAESGWDFSSRWFQDGQTLKSIDTVNVVPVDLNAFICGNLNILSFLFGKAGLDSKSDQYLVKYEKFVNVFEKVFYRENETGWYDYNLRTNSHNLQFYPSMAVPLFTGCYRTLDLTQSDKLFEKMEQMGAFSFKGGIPTSLLSTSQQWDFPNGWSPLNHMIIEGLRKADSPRMQQKAFELAEKWILSNMMVWSATESMWEKYNVNGSYPHMGSGGEYAVQAGFGWTNGAVLDLMVTYAQRFAFPSLNDQNTNNGDNGNSEKPQNSKKNESDLKKTGNGENGQLREENIDFNNKQTNSRQVFDAARIDTFSSGNSVSLNLFIIALAVILRQVA